VLANLERVIAEFLDSSDPSRVAIGIAAAGQIHPQTHAVVYAPNLNWQDVPRRDEVESAFGLPTYVDNDVRAAARLVLGGGIMLSTPRLTDALAQHVARRATVMSRRVRVAMAALGDSAGIFGAADRLWLHI
jgi:predicted NBD/HSP70 family sugar kinase